MRERTQLDSSIGAYRDIERGMTDNLELIEMGEAEGAADVVTEAERELAGIKAVAGKKQLETLLSGEADGNDCFLEVNAGAGGTEAQDWAQMLLRMYQRWAEQHGLKADLLDDQPGEEAGIKTATLQILGMNAFGWLKTESGVHRLVRISPFDSNARRHTSFSAVTVAPVVDDSIEVDINPTDLKVDTFRASGAGGQHVNRTESAVRFTHVPTGIVVACQQERSQHKNRDTAMKMLKARIYELELKKREERAQALEDEKSDIAWGHQIRSYVLHPYQMVKDLRTGVSRTDASTVLDGDLDVYLEAALAARIEGPGTGE
jgi:peptide chain release factor 2